ncbi:MAG: hypothetical protein UY55_C0005G0028 [Candidatus Jorgensenbacteria bacterium GW2011_GWB1_50_10]|uniref:Uncharacterized protein n=1 Tax=Candidatus Jorgensenbacteria bacterium GW2011_GWB1_50_10 TaxID=1618665 RepID=A0A0G1W7X0_9BACT|nr:MAG: hypothetical protein UY55_C0005G0028 [Candidatus Jorgensenbacteria bacterium GW2011_GWB1_50_10]
MANFTWTLIVLSTLGSITAFGLFLANIITTGNNPIILWVQSIPPLEFLLVFVALLILVGVLLRPKPHRRR